MKRKTVLAVAVGMLIMLPSAEAAPNSVAPAGVPKTIAVTDGSQAEQKAPFKVAVCPIIDRSGWASQNLTALLKKRLDRELHVPLNGYLNKIKIYDGQEVAKACQSLSVEPKSAKDSTAWLKGLADKLEADMAVCVFINSCYERTWMNWRGDTLYESYCEIELAGWDRANNKPAGRKAERCVHDDCAVSSDVETLALEALEEILERERLRDRFFPTKNK